MAADPAVISSAKPPLQGQDTWNEWSEGTCNSGCTYRSRGARERRRTCSENAICDGSSYDVALCDDSKVIDFFI